jgi:CPA2 family monovalent cation:H+ antiporter-2
MDTHAYTDLTGVAVVALAALLGGVALERLRQPAFVGYIFAGLLLGPTALGIVSNREQIDTIADFGVLMLLFVIGLELPLRLFVRLWRISLIATMLQIAAGVTMMALIKAFTGWSTGMAVLLGFVVALSSTAVAIKIVEDAGEMKTRPGRLALGVLIAQDLAFVPMILVIGMFAVGRPKYESMISLVGAVTVMGWLIWHLAKGGKIPLPFVRDASRHVDLTPLSALAMCFGAAAVSGFLGLTPAYGAFLGGLMLGNAGGGDRHALVHAARPIQSVLMMAFFLSIGLLIDLKFIWENLGIVMLLLFLVTIFKTGLNTAIFRAMGQSWPQSFMLAVVLAQVGEFSFLLARNGLDLKLIGAYEMRLVVAVTVLSLALSPIWVVTARRLHAMTEGAAHGIGDLLGQVYRPETELARRASARAKPGARALALRIRLLAAKLRERKLKPSNENVSTAPRQTKTPSVALIEHRKTGGGDA